MKIIPHFCHGVVRGMENPRVPSIVNRITEINRIGTTEIRKLRGKSGGRAEI